MAANSSDPESQRRISSDEQTPLLGDRRASASASETEEHHDNDHEQQQQQHEQTRLLENGDGRGSPSLLPRDEHEQAALLEPPPEKRQRTRSWWAWRVFWAILAAAVLAVFIKGWIDADNTQVSDCLSD
ncbi:hypothetical protein SLS62_004912 [Diatrype stigma]|uniref:Uncharacterized protein n=1 Tax=Diatrype stigma TaxID=117547 RepID=A0AAN9V296_9PEZI